MRRRAPAPPRERNECPYSWRNLFGDVRSARICLSAAEREDCSVVAGETLKNTALLGLCQRERELYCTKNHAAEAQCERRAVERVPARVSQSPRRSVIAASVSVGLALDPPGKADVDKTY